MTVVRHPDYQEEEERLQYTLGYIDKTIISQVSKKAKVDKTVETTMKHFDSADSEKYITLMINTMLQDRMGMRLKNLSTARSKPYFARVDFLEDSLGHKEKMYIGKTSLIREEDQEVLIVDWRAPAANLYYEERLGRAAYDCPEGRIDGELSLKRQYSIDKGQLLNIMDIDITTNDEFLQSYLGASADNRLKDIVSTIQAEQNRVIRADMWNPLIVQGAAGSGKTTIALHRIAYLIYTYEKTIKPESFMIIAPNKLFLNYISEVLPELGVEKVKQTTFIDLALDCIGIKVKLEDSNDKLALLTDTSNTETLNNRLISGSSAFKSSMRFKELLGQYISIIAHGYLPEGDFKLGPKVLMTYDEIKTQFLNEYSDIPFAKRLVKIKNILDNRVKMNKNSICESLQRMCDEKIAVLKKTVEDEKLLKTLVIKTIDDKNHQIDQINNTSKFAAKDYINKIKRKTILQYYIDFFTTDIFKKLSQPYMDSELSRYIIENTTRMIAAKALEIEDLAPLLYLKLELEGLEQKIPIEHIVVDEAQDLSVFQLYLLRRLIRGSSMTILGDLFQGIHSYRGTTDWKEVIDKVFNFRCEYLNLRQSYRTTVEIMEAANKVIKKLKYSLPLAEPVIRHGEKPELKYTTGVKDTAAAIALNIKSCENNGYKTMAIICKTSEECIQLSKELRRDYKDFKVLTGKEKEYTGGVVILPAYLAKGLEFDAVIIADASEKSYPADPLHTKLLYVAMTRPLHRLYIYCKGSLSPLLSDF